MAWVFILIPSYFLLAFIMFDLVHWGRPAPPPMGKTARNERRKLTATFLDNIAVTAVAAAAALSLFEMFKRNLPEIVRDLDAMPTWQKIDYGSGIFGALLMGLALHLWALRFLSDIED